MIQDFSVFFFVGRLDLVQESRESTIERGLVVSLGFGGADAAICVESAGVSEPAVAAPPVTREEEDIFISGIGVLIPEEGTETRPGEESAKP